MWISANSLTVGDGSRYKFYWAYDPILISYTSTNPSMALNFEVPRDPSQNKWNVSPELCISIMYLLSLCMVNGARLRTLSSVAVKEVRPTIGCWVNGARP